MTRRIAIAILLTTWVALLAGSVVAYVETRYVLLTDMDAAIVTRARTAASGTPAEGDRYVVRDMVGRTLARLPIDSAGAAAKPEVVKRTFATLADGRRQRTLTLRWPDSAGGATIVYSSSAERFDQLLNRLALVLVVTCAVCGAGAAAAAIAVSRVALRPLRGTANTIGDIDERHLDRRINTDELPIELRPMASRLNEMLARLQSAFEQRRQFLAAASHELRTPVAALLTTIEVSLRRPRSPEELTDTLRSCLSDAKALRHLVNALMQQVRGETPAAASEKFEAVALLNEVADTVTAAAAGRPIALHRSLPAALPVRGEPMRVRSIITNLLTNALEYAGPNGHVELACSIVPGGQFEITVTDDGPGIAAEFLPHVFEPFARGAKPAASDEGHLGLGLALVKAHVDALGGRCEAGNLPVPEHGAVFRVRLPGVIESEPARPNSRALEVVR